jgi:hypothetical protein
MEAVAVASILVCVVGQKRTVLITERNPLMFAKKALGVVVVMDTRRR